MLVWWAAFFICGVAFPPGACDEAIVSLTAILAVLSAFVFFDSERKTTARAPFICVHFAIIVIGGIVLWQSAGMASLMRNFPPEGKDSASNEISIHSKTADKGFRSLILDGAKRSLTESIEQQHIPPHCISLMEALVLADRTGLDSRLREAYADVGIAHFLALSGLHLGILAIPIACVLARIAKPPFLRDLLSFSILFLYSSVVGFPASLVRALFLVLAFLALRNCGFSSDLMGALVLGSFVALAIDGSLAFDIAFQLSFCAVVGIALIGVPTIKFLGSILRGRLVQKAARLILYPAVISLAVQFFSLPLVVKIFGKSPLVTPIANLAMTVPLAVFLYLAVAFVFVPIGPVRWVLGKAIHPIGDFLISFPSYLLRLRLPQIVQGDANWIVYSIGIGIAAAVIKGTIRNRKLGISIAILTVAISFFSSGNRGLQPRKAAAISHISSTTALLKGRGIVFIDAGRGILVIGEKLESDDSKNIARELWKRGFNKVGSCIFLDSKIRSFYGLKRLLELFDIREFHCSSYFALRERHFIEELIANGTEVDTIATSKIIERGRISVSLEAPIFPPPPGVGISRSESRVDCFICETPSGGERECYRISPDE